MKLPPDKEQTVVHQFDSFCKRVLRNAACDCHREYARLRAQEISFSDLTEKEMNQLACEDVYFERLFHVLDYTVIVQDIELADAISMLPDRQREIVLLYYLIGMTDSAIADYLGLQRRHVGYIRANALQSLKGYLEGGD